ncbi:AarF/ABC1/UbiB kinase family protein [Micromonospora sp. FIMYZ51]|uniref:ABC1 kinase family protein n=1 Tax=Micromonospora sp. FIMYZ51 TaxID=3051832 RepID=UPI0031204930
MTEIPRRASSRAARIASLPLGFAGRQAVGLGKRVAGRSSAEVTAEIHARTAEQIFQVLGELKGGAMKLGQALSIFQAVMPDETAAAYAESLVKLQEDAPRMPPAEVHAVLADQLGPRWRDRFAEFDDVAAAAASIGQVHKARWRLPDGSTVPAAVKVQYPGTAEALDSDLKQVARLGSMLKTLQPSTNVKALIAEMRERILEELDYTGEAENQRRFAEAYAGDPEIYVPRVLASTPAMLVTEWAEGTPLSKVIASGSQQERDEAGRLLALFHFSAPTRAGLLHADPHPGNFRMMPDGRLCVLDFGAAAQMPGGLPKPIGRLIRAALDGDAETVRAGLRDEGFFKKNRDVEAPALLAFLLPMIEPFSVAEFKFTRDWMRTSAAHMSDRKAPGAKLTLPTSYLFVHRVMGGSMGVLCQLEARAPFQAIVHRWLPGFAPVG